MDSLGHVEQVLVRHLRPQLNTAPSDPRWYCSIRPILKSALYSRVEAHFDNTELMQNCPHLGQRLLGLLWGTAVCLSDITEGEGHVLKGEVAVRWQKVGKKAKMLPPD